MLMKKVVKKKKLRKCTKRIMLFGLISCSLSVFMLISILSVVVDIMHKYQEAGELQNKLVSLEKEEEELEEEIIKLQDPEYLARYAREKYFYSKDNELIIRIPTE